MSETKNNQPAVVGLPEKEWFTLAEVADRWGCDQATVLHYGGVGGLVIGTLLSDWLGEIATGAGTEVCVLSGFVPLLTPDVRRIEITGAANVKSVCWFIKPSRTLRYFTPKAPIVVTPGKLFIERQERDRFEQEHGIGAYAGAMPELDHQSTDKKPGRPKQVDSLGNRLPELMTAAIAEAERQKAAGQKPDRASVARHLAASDGWRQYATDTLKPKIRAHWWGG